ncbi:MAG: acylphosphatase [Microgenomates group bacterium]
MKTIRLIISGSVQGIGFRKWIKRQAQRASVTGWVKNREDGAVESVVQGEADAIQQLIIHIHQGPPLALVEGVFEEPIEDASRYEDFIVIQ